MENKVWLKKWRQKPPKKGPNVGQKFGKSKSLGVLPEWTCEAYLAGQGQIGCLNCLLYTTAVCKWGVSIKV